MVREIRSRAFVIYFNTIFEFVGDEMFSDTYKMKLIDDVLYEVYGKVCSQIYLKILQSISNLTFRYPIRFIILRD